MNPDIERLCRAAYEAFEEQGPLEHVGPDDWLPTACLDGDFDLSLIVHAILSELRKPSERMVDAADEVRTHLDDEANGDIGQINDNTEATWQAMISHILRDGE